MPSNESIKKAGKILRNYWLDPRDAEDFPEDELEPIFNAWVMADDYRASFAQPMLAARMGLKSFVGTCGYPDAKIGQRLKRLNRIVAKLVRFNPQMQLTRMQDIGGVRVVLSDVEAVVALDEHIHKRWDKEIKRYDDYISSPQESGYRAVHIVVERRDRLIEVQLRSERQNDWAQLNESLSRQAGAELKWGVGAEDVKEFLRLLAESMATLDSGGEVDEKMRNAVKKAASEVA